MQLMYLVTQVELKATIEYFLNCMCCLTPRWFNKPKFHILVHLPEHIRRFGPPMLFATEGFESFNAIIRAHSVHSNRHAPSRDIAKSMAQCNRTRHLLSGGYFQRRKHSPFLDDNVDSHDDDYVTQLIMAGKSPWLETQRATEHSEWITIGPQPRALVQVNEFAQRILGIKDDIEEHTSLRAGELYTACPRT